MKNDQIRDLLEELRGLTGHPAAHDAIDNLLVCQSLAAARERQERINRLVLNTPPASDVAGGWQERDAGVAEQIANVVKLDRTQAG
jgi:hypothetical protein